MLSILSYSKQDEIVLEKLSLFDILRLPFNEQIKGLAGELHNHLGMIGAFVAYFFINDTIGYASVILPVFMMMWGWVLLRKKPIGREATFTNYAIIFGLLLSSIFGVANLIIENIDKEWSGVVGAFVAEVSTKLLGTIGASIVLFTGLCITVILAIDLDIHKSLERLSAAWAFLSAKLFQPKPHSEILDLTDESDVMINKTSEEEPMVHAGEKFDCRA